MRTRWYAPCRLSPVKYCMPLNLFCSSLIKGSRYLSLTVILLSCLKLMHTCNFPFNLGTVRTGLNAGDVNGLINPLARPLSINSLIAANSLPNAW